MKRIAKWIVIGLFAFVTVSNIWIVESTRRKIKKDSRMLLGAEIGLVLGTSNQLANGESNPFFTKRIEAAKTLLNSGKVDRLLLSGSKDSIYYDEAEKMKNALIELGVNEKQIILDKQGNRTLQSLKRLKEKFGYEDCVIVTQSNHAYRALFIADHLGIKAVCFAADPPSVKSHYTVMVREVFARAKAVIDLYLITL